MERSFEKAKRARVQTYSNENVTGGILVDEKKWRGERKAGWVI